MQQNAFDAALGRLSSLLGGGDEPEAAAPSNAMATARPMGPYPFLSTMAGRGIEHEAAGDEPRARHPMLPIADWGDGPAFAIPGTLKDAYEALGRFHRGESPQPEDAVLAGLVMSGGAFGGLARSGGNAMVRAAANPKEAAPAGALAMDAASRAGRARAMGFDPDKVFYHGSQAGDIEAFDLGRANTGWRGKAVHVSEDPEQAAMYGADGRDFPGAIYPLNLRLQNTADFQTIRIPRSTLSSDDLAKVEADWGHLIGDGDIPAEFVTLAAGPDAMAGALQKLGYDSFRDGPHVAVFDPKNIRSKFAAFDPAKMESADLLASNPPSAAGIGAVAASDGREHHSRSQPRGQGGRFVGRDSFDGRMAALDKMLVDLDGDGVPDAAVQSPPTQLARASEDYAPAPSRHLAPMMPGYELPQSPYYLEDMMLDTENQMRQRDGKPPRKGPPFNVTPPANYPFRGNLISGR